MQTQTETDTTQTFFRIILVEEHAEVRNALTRTLVRQLEHTIVWATPYLPTTAEELLDFEPSVIVIGLPQQAIASLDTLIDQVLVWTSNQVPVISLAAYMNLEEAYRLNQAGVFATLLKTADSAEAIDTIKAAVKVPIKENSHV